MEASGKLEFQPEPGKRLFHRCQVCGSEWPTSAEYCRRCAVWLGPTECSEEILWYQPANQLPTGAKRIFSNGIYEATVLTVAACENVYVAHSKCPELLLKASGEILAFEGLITRGPGGHLTGCFLGRDLIEAAKRAVQCAQAVQARSETYGLKTFMGINSGPIVVRSRMDQGLGYSYRKVSGGVLGCSEAVAFSLYPRMILLSPAAFRLVASHFECYGTGPIGLWGMYPRMPKTVYVVTRAKKVTSWKDQLNDDAVPIVGREEEMRLLCQHWEETRSGEMPVGSMVHLVGEPGSGKSKLLQAFLARVGRPGNDMALIKLAGANYGSRSGLLLEEFVSECSRIGVLCDKPARGGARAESETLLTSIPRSIPARVRLVSRLLGELKSRGPTLIVMDDVHWADRESMELFGEAFSNLPAGVMVVASYRPSGSWLASLLRKSSKRQIALGPLEEDEAKQISRLHSKQGEWISGSAWRELWKKSQGNPLYVEEATKLLLTRKERPVAKTPPGINAGGIALPGTRAGLLSARIKEWAERELDELRQELSLRWGGSVSSRLATLETQVNDWLDRLETEGYLERTELAECLDELEHFQKRVVEVCLVGGLSRPLTTRLGEALSRLYEGSYEDHYRYLQERGKTEGENRSAVGSQAFKVAERAIEAGKLREAITFFRIAEELLPSDYPLRRYLLEKAGDANLMLGRSGEAARLYERAIIETRITDPHDDLAHKLVAARLLKGERLDSMCLSKNDPCPWHLILVSAGALPSRQNDTALLVAQQAREVSSNWVTLSAAYLLEALAHIAQGDHENAAMLCRQAAETMEGGGLSLLSVGLYWVLAQIERDTSRKTHMHTWKTIARQLGITSGLKVFQSKFDCRPHPLLSRSKKTGN